jgi:hypothetical protein
MSTVSTGVEKHGKILGIGDEPVTMVLQDADDIGWGGNSGGTGGAAEAKSMTGHSDGRGNGAEGPARASCGSKLSQGLLGVIKAEKIFCAQLATAENFENATFLQVPPQSVSVCAHEPSKK